MTRGELKNELIKKRVKKDSYSLNGGLPNEAYCLNRLNDSWEVYYSEKGNKTNLKFFKTESSACYFLYKLLVNEKNVVLKNDIL